MQNDAWYAFATNDVRAMDRGPELLADAFADAFSVRDIQTPACIDCLARALGRSTGEVVDEVMSLYARLEVDLTEEGHCSICSRRTVVVA